MTVFVHVVGPDGLVAQDDSLPAQGQWQTDWWQPRLLLRDRHEIALPPSTSLGNVSDAYHLHIGWYDAATQTRLPVMDVEGNALGDAFIWPNHGANE